MATAMISALVEFLVTKVGGLLPQFLRRWLLPPQRVADQVRVELHRQHPVDVVRSAVPFLRLRFEIDNASLVDVTLDRLLITELWAGQPIGHGAILERHAIPKRSRREDIQFTMVLNDCQLAQVDRVFSGAAFARPSVEVYVLAYFDSPVGVLRVERRGGRQLQAFNIPIA